MENQQSLELYYNVINTDRSIGARLSGEIATQVGAVFILAWLIRHTLLRQHIWARKQQFIQLDTALLFAMSTGNSQ